MAAGKRQRIQKLPCLVLSAALSCLLLCLVCSPFLSAALSRLLPCLVCCLVLSPPKSPPPFLTPLISLQQARSNQTLPTEQPCKSPHSKQHKVLSCLAFSCLVCCLVLSAALFRLLPCLVCCLVLSAALFCLLPCLGLL